MIASKIEEISAFCKANASEEVVKKYTRYFKEGFDGYGIEQKLYEQQRDAWIKQWQAEMTLADYLDLADELFQHGRYEEKALAISFVQSQRNSYTGDTFVRIGNWFNYGINNWATTDVLCMLVLSSFLFDKIISLDDLKSWHVASSEWQRRVIPVTLVELAKKELKPADAFDCIGPLMLDESEYVQKGIGTLMRTLWKKQPAEVEAFLLNWKDRCGRLIVQYATEKMDKEYRKQFRKVK